MQQGGWLKKLQVWGARPTRRMRHWIVGVCLVTPFVCSLTAMFELYPWRDSGRLYGAASCISAFIAIGLGLFLLRLVRRVFLQVSLEDRAQMDYGKAFDRLTGISAGQGEVGIAGLRCRVLGGVSERTDWASEGRIADKRGGDLRASDCGAGAP